MMKLSGALLLVLGCAGFGWCTCRDMERHIGQLHLLSRAFSMLESEVGYSRATLPEGLIRVGNRLGGRLGEYFINVGKKAQGPEGITFAAAWDEEVAGFLKETYLDKKEEELLLSFPGFTGFVDGQMQLISLEQFGKEIRRAEEKARKETEAAKRRFFP